MSIHTDGKDVKSRWSLTAYNTQIRPQNIGNIHPPRCKKKSDATMERTGGRRRKHLVLHRLYRWIISLTKHMIASLLSLMFCINLNLIPA